MPKSILVIDDEAVVSEITKRKLENSGYEAETASDGTEALDRLKHKIPDLILLDVQMKNMNGYTFIMEISKIPAYAQIPVVVLTAYDDMESLFKRHGLKAYLQKPVKFEDLFKKVVEIVGQP